MKKLLFLSLAVVSIFMASNSVAALISGVTIKSVSSEYIANGWDLGAVHIVDGSGLSDGKHSLISSPGGNSWQTISQSGTGNIVFDLGDIYDLDFLHVWNLNFFSPYNGRGAHQVDILLSSDMTSWSNLGNFNFQIATAAVDDPGFTILATSWAAARYVQFDIKNNFNLYDNAGHVGLSEVQFYSIDGQTPVPEPSTALLLGVGVLGLAGVRRKIRV